MKKTNYIMKYILLAGFIISLSACVETITDPVTGTPTIEIYKPLEEDTVQLGKNRIYYDSYDADGLKDNLSHFEVFINGESNGVFQHEQDSSITPIYLNITDNLLVNSRISYYVLTYDKRGVHTKSIEIEDVFVDRSPASPDGLVLQWQNELGTIVNLVWNDNATNESNYELWRKDGIEGDYKLIKTLSADIFSTNDHGLQTFINYYYKVRATNAYGGSTFSNVVNSKGIAGGDAPSELKAEALGATKIILTWKDNSSDELGFFVERLNNNNGEWEKIKLLPSNTTEFLDQNLVAGNTYKYRVFSYSTDSQSAYSNEAQATTAWQDVLAPDNLIAVFNPDLNAVILNWKDKTVLEDGTYIERKTGLGGMFVEINSVDIDIETYSDSLIEAGKTYYYRVRHHAVAGHYTEYSNTAVVFIPETAPKQPTDFSITEFTSGVLYGLTWKYNSTIEIDGFELQRKIGENGDFETYKIFSSDTRAFNDSISVQSEIHYYKLRSFRGTLLSDFTEIVSTSGSLIDGLESPANLSLVSLTSAVPYEIKISWDDKSSQEYGFIIERKDNINSSIVEFREISRVGPNVKVYSDASSLLVRGGLYTYRIRAYNAQNESGNSNELNVQIPW
ncbi:MAG: fibronectin type III domain-containing protein [Tenericutes bacterium]|nr:fibronectin type III domain-containing protein [Mycoplasmatota bacterium]MBI9009672.1 fibronectin type III domain-containing protein [Mycoplasmatota bacterium]